MKLENKNIIIVSNEPWGDIWYSKQNWAYELSLKNHVLFLNPPSKWSFLNLFSHGINYKKYSETLKIISYNNRLPFTRISFIAYLNDYIISLSFRKWLKNKNFNHFIFWTFDPYRFSNPNYLKPSISIYFRVDKYTVKKEYQLLKNVHYLIATAKELIQETSFTGTFLELSHGISMEEFNISENIEYEKGYILYIGNIDFRIDVTLLELMLNSFPNERFLFIGKLYNENHETFQSIFYSNKYKNLILHGIEHYKKLKNYIYFSKACIVPMDINVHGNAVHHHKTLQYLAMGKPVISPLFNDKINNKEIILAYSNANEAIKIIKSLENTETIEKVQNRINFAKEFTYDILIKKIEHFLTEEKK